MVAAVTVNINFSIAEVRRNARSMLLERTMFCLLSRYRVLLCICI
jgi:hypothetical protein